MALVAYLESKPLALPEVIDSSGDVTADSGTLTVPFAAGDLFVESAEGLAYRLSWTKGEAEGARTRSLPEGVYKLRTYRILGEKEGESWHISGTAPTIREIEVLAGENVAVDIDQRITLKPRIRRSSVSTAIGGDKGAGVTIYRGQKRIDMGYRLMDDDGEQVASGSMRYG